jgi:MinD-like ATPase involved in chromosome partitioning or flagellar assembly
MKSIIIYSGKGGVGKTTTTANIAKTLVDLGKKVYILDADVNTPSMNTIFPNPEPNTNLKINSLGYVTEGMIFIQSSLIRSYIKDAIKDIKVFDPDFVLIDTPPSITDVHLNLIDSIQASGIIMVTQPTNISESDVRRTAFFFDGKGVKTIGIVENMSLNNERQYDLNLLARITFVPGFDYDKVLDANAEAYKTICNVILNVDDVILENEKTRPIEKILTEQDLRMHYAGAKQSEKMGILVYHNLDTWNWVRDMLMDMPFISMDERIIRTDSDTIKRVIDHFDGDHQAYFMVTRAPNTVVPLLTGEIGQGVLFYPDKNEYYGVPRIKYQTKQGEVQLFPDEIHPMSMKEIQMYVNEGYILSNDGRYIPSLQHLEDVYNAFGSRVGLRSDYKKTFHSIISGEAQDPKSVVERQVSVYEGDEEEEY